MVKERVPNPTIDTTVAHRWLELAKILQEELRYVTGHRKFGDGWKDIHIQDIRYALKALDEGSMTRISKRSLKKKSVRFKD